MQYATLVNPWFTDMAISMAQDPAKTAFYKLSLLAQAVPDDLVLPREWLLQQGFTDDNLTGYVRSGYLSRVGRALYAKPQAGRSWLFGEKQKDEGALPTAIAPWKIALSSSLLTEPTPLAVAGYSALEVRNLAHFYSNQPLREIWVTGPKALPRWVAQMNSVDWRLIPAGKLFVDAAGMPTDQQLFNLDTDELDHTLQMRGFEAIGRDSNRSWIVASTPERALLEWASQLNTEADWRHFYEVMEGVPSLRPTLLRTLLARCKSVKAKRVFLWMGKQLDASWYHALKRDMSGIDLGKGKRQLIPGGALDTEYQITVVREISDGV